MLSGMYYPGGVQREREDFEKFGLIRLVMCDKSTGQIGRGGRVFPDLRSVRPVSKPVAVPFPIGLEHRSEIPEGANAYMLGDRIRVIEQGSEKEKIVVQFYNVEPYR